MKYISILGSTGSIGTQTLDIVRENRDKIAVCAITGNNNINLLKKQIEEFNPELCAVMDESNALKLKEMLNSDCKTEILSGMDGLVAAATYSKSEIIVTAVSGMIGIKPTIEAIKAKKTIALANKETLVAGGDYIMNLAKRYSVDILPVDSEHSAIFQSLMGDDYKKINKIILTASGGPFRGKTLDELKNVTVKDALNHPNWSMGRKITIDSSTLMNKGLEVIEAKYLFDVEPEKIEVVVHPQSIVHSGVEFVDHSTVAQLGLPDMRVPIQVALFYPERVYNDFKSLSLAEIGSLTFEKPDPKVFRCLQLAFDALKVGETMPAVLNAANEETVSAFLDGRLKFLDIARINEEVMLKHNSMSLDSLETILEAEKWARRTALELMQ